MLHTLSFSLQNAVHFIMLPFLVSVLFTFYIQGSFSCSYFTQLNCTVLPMAYTYLFILSSLAVISTDGLPFFSIII
jgi:hypothetical protein